ncbi:peptidase domain-containing ABC transporter [Sabulicella rubraurantiaca]|uniref:peptidase domain-containing ABC transporter n=1 Tax=Sabulicella rubraurantiaca TaxID=2811429 RepID=UPI001A974417|nr:peptidase domain-containing ABC transporter [Sabulicella rubraurantiaca]
MSDTKASATPLTARPAALQALAARVGLDLDQRVLAILSAAPEVEPHALVSCAADRGIAAKAMQLGWGDLLGLAEAGTPTMIFLRDGGAALLDGASADRSTVSLRNPLDLTAAPTAVDRQRLERLWLRSGIVVRSGPLGEAGEEVFGLRWVTRTLSGDTSILRDMGLASVILSVAAIAPALIFMAISDRVLLYQSHATLTLFVLLLGVIIMFETALGWARRHLAAVLARRVEGRISLLAMQRLLRLPLDFFEKTPAGEIQSRLFQIYKIRDFITGPLFRTFLDVVTLLIVIPVLFLISPVMTYYILGLAVVLVLLILAFRPAIRSATAKVIDADRAKVVAMVETVQGMRTVKALGIEAQRSEAWNRNVAASLKAQFDLQVHSNRLETLSTPFERMFQAGSMVLGAIIILNGDSNTSIGGVFSFTMLAMRAAQPLVSLAQLLHAVEQVRLAIGESTTVLNHPPERAAHAVGVRPEIKGHVSFSNVTFTYPGTADPVLRNVSFDVPVGTMIGLVGRSGSGKSTVTRLVQALNAGYSGLIKLDSIEMREMDLPHLRRNLGVVLQENFMFRGTIRENIIAGRPGISFDKVIQACRLAGAEEFIERFPRSYDTFIEEGSPNLSGGQKQRLAIARALVTEPPILIFDEATSALDPESEAIVNANLRRIGRGRTIILVSHRLSSLVDADQILVLDAGEVVGNGTHPELLRNNTLYRQLWMQQNRDAGRMIHESDRVSAVAG